MAIFDQLPPDISWADEIFDGMMISRAAVYKNSSIGVDAGGQPINEYEELVRDVPCFVRPEGGKELNVPPAPPSETSLGIATFLIFMRPLLVDSPPVPLNNHHWLQIKTQAQVLAGVDYKDPNDPLAGVLLYNITNVNNPGLLDHHYEVAATVLEP